MTIETKVTLTQPGCAHRQFVVTTGSGHHFLVDDLAGSTGARPIELVAAGIAGCTAFDVISYLRYKRPQVITGYEVRVEAEQAEQPPQVFNQVRIHHVLVGRKIDPTAVEEAVDLSTLRYGAVQAMLRPTTNFVTTFEIVPEKPVAEAA